ncbi:MAG: protease, partial [Planctomycetes bacterium RBG_16_43_13]
MELKGKTVVILVEDLYQELEVWYPLYRLREAGAVVVVVGTGKKSYKSKLGYEVQPNADINDVKAGDFDGIIIPGGYAPDILRRFPAVNEFVADVFKRGGVVAAICHGLWVCVSARIL